MARSLKRMTRQEMIDKLYEWYCDWIKDATEPTATEMKENKWQHLNTMPDEKLKELYVQELIRREQNA